MTQPATPPRPATGMGDLSTEFSVLREGLRLIDEIDRQTIDMVERLAEAVRTSGGVRARASLEIAASIERLERLIDDRDVRQRELMVSLQQDVTVAHARALSLGAAIDGLERKFTGMEDRLVDGETAPSDAGGEMAADGAAGSQPAAPETERPVPPLPTAGSLFVEVERVPSAGAALSIQRYVSQLPRVVAATTREYAAGHLRLEVRARGPIDSAEFLGWPGGRLELVAQEADSFWFRIVE